MFHVQSGSQNRVHTPVSQLNCHIFRDAVSAVLPGQVSKHPLEHDTTSNTVGIMLGQIPESRRPSRLADLCRMTLLLG